MKKLTIAATAMLLLSSSAYAADTNKGGMQQGGAMKGNMMQGDMMKNCQQHMKDGKMMDSMPKDMMEQCHKMMKDGGMMGDGMMKQGDMMQGGMDNSATPKQAPSGVKEKDHKEHHPEK